VFAEFRARITRGYVMLAVALIVAIVGASSALALLLYSRGLNDAIGGAAARAQQAASQLATQHVTPAKAAPQIVAAVGRSRFHVAVFDDRGNVLAQNEREGPPSVGRAFVIAVGRAIDLPHARVEIAGGSVSIGADFDRFGELLLWYWSIMLPVGAIAVLLAWFAGRWTTARAIRPLSSVTQSLKGIAGGDFAPQPLLSRGEELRDLTDAYNEVAYALAAATAERERAQTQMRQFIADAGHELRTPLTIVMGYLDALRSGIVTGEDATQRTYETMIDESRKMRTLIEKLILLARLDRTPAAPLNAVDLSEITRRAAQTLKPLGGERVDLHADGALDVLADEAELFEAIKNTIDNALKYAPSSRVDVTARQDAGQACVIVADRGPGMEPQDVAHAFDRFYRGSSRGETEGSGLGLAIAKRAVERAGGTASVQSVLGEGTTVTLCLPLKQ
jgi:two-component system OmpR family sensor kinase